MRKASRQGGTIGTALRWSMAACMPWAIAGGLLVSFSATAGHDSTGGYRGLDTSLYRRPALLLHAPEQSFGQFVRDRDDTTGLLHQAALTHALPLPKQVRPLRETPPRPDIKANTQSYPDVDRANKGDPLVHLRPSLPPDHDVSFDRLIFGHDEAGIASQFSPWTALPSDAEQMTALAPAARPEPEAPPQADEPRVEDELRPYPLAEPSLPHDPVSPAFAGDATTPASGRMRLTTTPRADGTTPLAVAALPVTRKASTEVAVAPVPAITAIPKLAPNQPDYAALIPAADRKRQMKCLAEAIYFEARSESQRGQAGVAQVVLNRVASELYPDSVCGVVYQNQHRYLSCQFTFTCEGKSLRINEPEAWAIATRIAEEVVGGETYLADVGGSTHYHANYVKPHWARALRKMDVIGKHVFYKLKPGQT